MKIIGLFFPALISLKISMARENGKADIIQVIIRYGLYVLLDNWLAQVIITYVLGMSDVAADALDSFPFFTKYVVITAIVAAVLPLCLELAAKYFKISVKTGVNGEENSNNKENK